MHIPPLGDVTKDEQLGSLCSAPIPVRVLQDRYVRIILEGYEEDENAEDFHSAINSFLSIGPEFLTEAETHVFSYYRDVDGFWDSPNEPVCIGAPSEVWAHVQFGRDAYVYRRDSGDNGIYISIECECDWEPEHGLQIVFRNGKSICKVGPYDGHATNADAFANAQLEDVIYCSLA
ncbi:DUF6985 domain-containing protein [Telluria aromaticivorans]|uniref:DUF6985 domain-containing protein n=1 Tax=Telluria aromaticivorans TaxID=2725995 RepID=UPI003530AE22